MEDRIFGPLDMDHTLLTGSSYVESKNITEIIFHTTEYASEDTQSMIDRDVECKYIGPYIFGYVYLFPDYLLSTAKDIAKLAWAVSNRGVGLDGNSICSVGTSRLMQSVVHDEDTILNNKQVAVNWNNVDPFTVYNTAFNSVPGSTYMNGCGCAIVPDDIHGVTIDPFPFDAEPGKYMMKWGLGQQLIIQMLSIGLSVAEDKSHLLYHTTKRNKKSTPGVRHVADGSYMEFLERFRNVLGEQMNAQYLR